MNRTKPNQKTNSQTDRRTSRRQSHRKQKPYFRRHRLCCSLACGMQLFVYSEEIVLNDGHEADDASATLDRATVGARSRVMDSAAPSAPS